MRHLKILATLTCTATVADAATNAGTVEARSWRAISRIAGCQAREMEGKRMMEVMDDD